MIRRFAPGWRTVAIALIALALGIAASIVVSQIQDDSPTADSVAEPSRQLREPGPARALVGPNNDIPEGLAFDGEYDPYPEANVSGPDQTESDDGEPLQDNGNESESDTAAAPAPSSGDDATSGGEPSAPAAVGPTTTTAPTANTPAPTTTRPPATARPTTTTTIAAAEAPAAPLDIDRFTDWPIRNTSLDSRTQFVNTPANQINWRQFTETSDRAIALGSTTPTKHLGQFRTQCSFSHFAYDDPLVLPGQAGASHLHMFFGNTEANADSTYRSIRDSGSSTCNGFEGNRTGYWIPAVFDAGGSARIPSRIEVYYKSHDRAFNNVQQLPEGLGMVAGTAATNPNIEWACQETGAQGTNLNRPVQQRQNTIPRCSGTATLLAHIKFPQCLSGSVGPNTGNGTRQMQYPTRGFFTNSCPAGTVYITAIEYFIAWNPDNHDGNTDQWWLSSDVRADNGQRAANGSTLHGDWFGGWNPELMTQIHDNCIARLAECSWDLVDNNQRLTWVEHFGQRNPAAYSGRRAIPAAELSAALCPSDEFAVAVDAAHCASRKPAAVGGVSITSDTSIEMRPGAAFSTRSSSADSDDEYVPFCSLLPPADAAAT